MKPTCSLAYVPIAKDKAQRPAAARASTGAAGDTGSALIEIPHLNSHYGLCSRDKNGRLREASRTKVKGRIIGEPEPPIWDAHKVRRDAPCFLDVVIGRDGIVPQGQISEGD